MMAGRPARILLIDTNVYFSKRLSDALKREGFEVTSSTQPAFALTTLEYDAPSAIVCSTNMREMGALDIARMIRADAKNAAMPIIALGDGGQRALMEAFQAGCDDYIDRTRPPAVIATHVKNIIISKAEGFKPTQMLAQSDTSLSGSLTHHDLPGVMQMLGHAHQTGALHINSGDTDALLFFDAGAITHAECGSLFGDEAVIHILKNCFQNNSGVYKFVYGSASTQRTVLRSATDLMLDAMREVDEATREGDDVTPAEMSVEEGHPSVTPEVAGAVADVQPAEVSAPGQADENPTPAPQEDFATGTPVIAPQSILHSNDFSAAPLPVEDSAVAREQNSVDAAPEIHDSALEHPDDFAAIADVLDRFAMTHSNDFSAAAHENENSGVPESLDHLAESDSFNHFTGAPIPDESAEPAPVENSEVPATDDHTDDQPLVTRPEEAL
jgi:CheY-like chemotaxis protein